MSKRINNLLIAASGTGGHIFPALTIAKVLEIDCEITWLGVKGRCETDLVPKKYNLHKLSIETPRKKNIFLWIQYLRIILATFQVIRIIRRRNIQIVFTTGGYISAPTILASKFLNIPVLIHESNLVPGTVTKYFGRFSDLVLTGFERTNLSLPDCKTLFTGTPIRDQFDLNNRLPIWVPRGEGPLILVMGGSQGSRGVNEIVYDSLDILLENDIRIVHILGENEKINLDVKNSKNYIQIEFTNDIAALMQNCDLVISRSGALTINELIKTNKPSILITFPNSKNDHQEKNALFLSSIGGSIIINQNNNSKSYLRKTLIRIFNLENFSDRKNSMILEIMKNNMAKLKNNNPREAIQKIIYSTLKDL
mgnify:CR=1 FL=1